MSVIGVVPARMGSSRFPGKPLHPILGMPLVEHCYLRAQMCRDLDELFIATPDMEIFRWADRKGYVVKLTPNSRDARALDCCAEAACAGRDSNDIVINIQGDEPMVTPENISAVIKCHTSREPRHRPQGSLLLVPLRAGINSLDDPNTVKALVDQDGWVMYTTRQPVPAAAGRVGGLLGFQLQTLYDFSCMAPNQHETLESCDINRWIATGAQPFAVPSVSPSYQSVDCLADVAVVERLLPTDEYWGSY